MPILSTIDNASIKGFTGLGTANALFIDQTIYEPSPGANAFFGWSVDITYSGNYIAIGAPPFYTSNTGTPQGQAFVYILANNTYTLQQSMAPGPGGFGSQVGISGTGEYLAVSSYSGNNTYLPSVYVYSRANTTWTEQANIIVGSNISDYCNSLALNEYGNVLVIGTENASSSAGKIYIYTRSNTTWTLNTTITGTTNTGFANIVKTNNSGNLVFTNQLDYDSGSRSNIGRIKVYELANTGNWAIAANIESPVNSNNYNFGQYFDINENGNKITVTNFAAGTASSQKIYNFENISNTFTVISEINNPIGSTFNSRLAINDDQSTIVCVPTSANTFYNFQNNILFQSVNNISFVDDTALNSAGNILITGSYNDNTQAANAGAVRVYKFSS